MAPKRTMTWFAVTAAEAWSSLALEVVAITARRLQRVDGRP